jgi:hypothetical protein
MGTFEVDETYTLLGVRADGVASIVDLVPASNLEYARHRALAMLAEHSSCRTIEVWFDGSMVEQHDR